MPTSMTVSGISVQSLTSFELLKNPQTGFKRISVTLDVDGLPPLDPPANEARGTVHSTSAVIRASQSVWNDLVNRIRSFPFTATIAHDAAGVVSDLSFSTPPAGAAAFRQDITKEVRSIRGLLESALVKGDHEWVLKARRIERHEDHKRNGRPSETFELDPTGTDGLAAFED